jgi:type IV secretory pathway VirB10-like protein
MSERFSVSFERKVLQRDEWARKEFVRRYSSIAICVALLSACATTDAPKETPVAAAAPVVVAPPAPPPTPPPPPPPPPPAPPLPVEMPAPSKEVAPQIELPSYARKGRRLPADGGEPGRVLLGYCKGFEVERDAASYYKRLERNKQLPSQDAVEARSREAGQTLTVQQVVERDWAIQRENARGSPQRCKVLGGSVDAGVAVLVIEADIYGKRQRGTATVTPVNGKWRVRDHGGWQAIKSP